MEGVTIKRAIYAGSFDPFTNGHLSIVKSAAELFDEVLICIAKNTNKDRYTDIKVMTRAIENVLRDEHLENCKVVVCDTLIAQYCKDHNIGYLVRGIRNTSDYLYEENIAKINQEINPDLKTIYFRADNEVISSSMIRELLRYGANIKKYVPRAIAYVLLAKEISADFVGLGGK